jgi:uridine kinase
VSGEREALIVHLGNEVIAMASDGPRRVAVDGPDAAGKTSLADELADHLRARDIDVARASIDGFHRPRVQRIARGELSAEGYYRDSFDLEAVRRDVLDPLGQRGDRRVVLARFDWRHDTKLDGSHETLPDGVVLVFDGVFLLRPELADCWETSLFVWAGWESVVERARVRDADAMGGADAVERRYRHRYLPGQALYLAAIGPHEEASIAIDNDDPSRPSVDRAAVRAGVDDWIGTWLPSRTGAWS